MRAPKSKHNRGAGGRERGKLWEWGRPRRRLRKKKNNSGRTACKAQVANLLQMTAGRQYSQAPSLLVKICPRHATPRREKVGQRGRGQAGTMQKCPPWARGPGRGGGGGSLPWISAPGPRGPRPMFQHLFDSLPPLPLFRSPQAAAVQHLPAKGLSVSVFSSGAAGRLQPCASRCPHAAA